MIEQLITNAKNGAVDFKTTMSVIDASYDFSETGFKNGDTHNPAGTNNGSCKLFSFAKLNDLDPQTTLNLFGDFYTIDVLQNPDAQDHQNIRNFMQYGWEGIVFEGNALTKK